jgi:hypothetical protein
LAPRPVLPLFRNANVAKLSSVRESVGSCLYGAALLVRTSPERLRSEGGCGPSQGGSPDVDGLGAVATVPGVVEVEGRVVLIRLAFRPMGGCTEPVTSRAPSASPKAPALLRGGAGVAAGGRSRMDRRPPGGAPLQGEPAGAVMLVVIERSVQARRRQESPAAFSCRSLQGSEGVGGVPLGGRAAGDGDIGPHPTPSHLSWPSRAAQPDFARPSVPATKSSGEAGWPYSPAPG